MAPKNPSFKAGMFLLETLTAGMYNQPLSIYREYIQNAVDSIDSSKYKTPQMRVEINLDPFSKKIEITDNGDGIRARDAEKVLGNIGISNKIEQNLRGFRGIGRLGGIAFSEKVTFVTKAKNENVESVQEWDCVKLNEIINDKKNNSMSLRQLFNKITKFSQNQLTKKTGSYFKVVLEGVTSFKNYLFDIQKIKNYLSEIAPLPFDREEFSYADSIDDYLSQRLNLYGQYDILLNGEPLYKPYKDMIWITKKELDIIDEVQFFEIMIDDEPGAYGWYGLRRDLLGSIAKAERSSGIKVRRGNILIGDSQMLSPCFREPRFNSYMVGEIHIDSDKLTPNSRRDDFVDNEYKAVFYNEVERMIGLPVSKEIRLRSRLASSKPASPPQESIEEKSSQAPKEPCAVQKVRAERPRQKECEHLLELLDKCSRCKNIASCEIGSIISRMGRKN